MSLTLQIQGLDHSDFTVLHTEFARPVLAKLQSPFAFLSKAIKISSQVLITETLRIIVVDCWLVVFFFFKIQILDHYITFTFFPLVNLEQTCEILEQKEKKKKKASIDKV